MRIITMRLAIIASLLLAVALAVALPTLSDTDRTHLRGEIEGRQKRRPARPAASPLSYRSPGRLHKLMAPVDAGVEEALMPGRAIRRVRRYGSYSIIEVTDAALASLDAGMLERVELRDDLNLIMLRRGQIDTTGPDPQVSEDLRQPSHLSHSLHLVQLFGPPTADSIRALKATGAKVVSYIPNNAYLLWASRAQLTRLRTLREQSATVQWDGPFHPAYKLDPHFRLDSVEQIPVSIEIIDSARSDQVNAQIRSLARKVLMPEFVASGTVHLKVLIESFKLKELARIPDVVAIEPWAEIKPADERANQIVAGALSQDTINSIVVSRPTRPGFLSFLNSLGFNSNFDFAVDISDTGLDVGSEDRSRIHPDFLDSAGESRIAYLHDFTSDALFHPGDQSVLPVHDTSGHGTLNASIVGGFNNKVGSAYADSLGFQYGLGVAPFARIGVSKVFSDVGDFTTNYSYTEMTSFAYRGGARIMSNSWGACALIIGFCNLYTEDSRVFDSLVRDADPEAPGNQEMTVIFAAGNAGGDSSGSISTPGTAKNVITVGASESFRATDSNGQSLRDGCGVPSTAADNASDIVAFSSLGHVQDGRNKPDLVAPGTHIVGAASQDRFFAAAKEDDIGVCDRYFPAGQTLYTWSSGTSQATPIVAGGAALAFQWLRTRQRADPSAALVKAFMLNSTSYMTGRFAGDSLPGVRQGWGLLNIARMFEETDRIIYDQSPSRTFNQSGGAPFEITGVISDPSKEFRVMLAWSDPPGISLSNAPYINQLNLEVTLGGVVYSGNQFSGQHSTPSSQKDFLNNVQGVRLPAGTTGPFVLRVWPTIIAGDGVPNNGVEIDQDFALVVTNGRETAVPVLTVPDNEGVSQGVSVTHSSGLTDSSLMPGETALVSVAVFNEAKAASANVTSATLVLVGGVSAASSYPAIEAGRSAANDAPFQLRVPSDLRCGSTARLELRLTTPVGQYTLPVRVRVGVPEAGPPQSLFEDDVDSGRVKWKLKKGFSVSTSTGTSGTSSYHAVDPGRQAEDSALASLTLKKKIAIPAMAGKVRLTFFHIFNFEPGFDGGVLEISSDGGQTWEDLGTRVIVGGYDGKVTDASLNPLGNRFAWTSRGRPGVFSRVVINLDDFAGKRIQLRFLAGFDEATGVRDGYAGWFIDDIRVNGTAFNCR